MSSPENGQCEAITESGNRCSRPAQENGFCYQHGPEDETIGEDTDGGNNQEEETMSEEGNDSTEIKQVREEVQSTTDEVVGYPLDGISSINHDEDSWQVAVEVVERKSVPDTQDILGRYEMHLDDDLTVKGYERTHRYRRDDMEHNV